MLVLEGLYVIDYLFLSSSDTHIQRIGNICSLYKKKNPKDAQLRPHCTILRKIICLPKKDSSLIFLFEIQAYCGYIIIRLGDANKKKKTLCLDAES